MFLLNNACPSMILFIAVWVTALTIVGIIAGIIVLIIIIVVVIWRTKHRDRVEVIVVKDAGGDKKVPPPRMMAPAPGPRPGFGQNMAPGAPPVAGHFPGGPRPPFGPRPPQFRPPPPRASGPVRFGGVAGGAAPVD